MLRFGRRTRRTKDTANQVWLLQQDVFDRADVLGVYATLPEASRAREEALAMVPYNIPLVVRGPYDLGGKPIEPYMPTWMRENEED